VICWRSNLGPTSFAADFSLALQKCVVTLQETWCHCRLLPTLEHLQAGGAITGAAISQHKWDVLTYLPLQIHAVVLHMPSAEKGELIERLHTTRIHDFSDVNRPFIVSVYVSWLPPLLR